MFCPKCKAEYRPGFFICSDCRVRLVLRRPEEAPAERKERFVEYEGVLFTFNPGDIAFIKSILDAEDIAYYFQGEQFNVMYGRLAAPARLMVEKGHVERVKELLKGRHTGRLLIQAAATRLIRPFPPSLDWNFEGKGEPTGR